MGMQGSLKSPERMGLFHAMIHIISNANTNMNPNGSSTDININMNTGINPRGAGLYRLYLPKFISITIITIILVLVSVTLAPMALASRPLSGRLIPGKVILILLDGTALDEWATPGLPNFSRILDRGAIGLMNTRTSRATIPRNTYVTIGAGTRAQGSAFSELGFNGTENYEGASAFEVYRRNTGMDPGDAVIVHPYIADLMRINSREYYTVEPGALGEAIRKSGLRVAVIGSSDSIDELARPGVSLAMDKNGRVDLGDVGRKTTKRDVRFPGGVRTNIDALVERFKEVYTKASLIVVDLGDTARVERFRASMTDEMVVYYKRAALAAADGFLAEVLPLMDLDKDLLILVSPTPPASVFGTTNALSPIACLGPGIEHGFLTSATTRRRGIVTNIDIAPTILDFLDIKAPYSMLGRPLRSISPGVPPAPATPVIPPGTGVAPSGRLPGGGVMDVMLALEHRLILEYNQRTPLSKGFVISQILSVIVALGLILLRYRLPLWVIHCGQVILLAMVSAPLSMLLTSLFPKMSIAGEALKIGAGALIIALVCRRLGGDILGPFALAGFATTTALIVDTLYGARLIQGSVLSYDVIGGARYYGIGNEYMGILIGASIIASAAFLDRWRITPASQPWRLARWLVISVFALATLVLAMPSLGANLGGTIAAVVAFGVSYTGFAGRRVTTRKLLGLMAICFVIVVGISLFDSLVRGADESHWGKTVEVVASGGPSALGDIIMRKISMNLKLIRYTVWTKVLLSFILVFSVLVVRPVGLLVSLWQQNPAFTRGFAGCLAGCAAAFAVNDSGVVAAATIILFPSMYLLYLALTQK
ncbi:MAG TPA: hypothetical protein GXX51_01085 [Firmicutes bacterium]|nr:hypothetical protein [Bacillota bacterium]